MKCCPSQSVEREFLLCLYRLHRNKKERLRVELRTVLIIISASACSVTFSTSHTTDHLIPHHTKVFCLAMVDFHFLNFTSPSYIAACVQINCFFLWDALFYSALLDIHMQLLGGLNEKQEVSIPLR